MAHACTLQSGLTALIVAARNGHVECARLLLDAGADKEAADNVRRVCLSRLRSDVGIWSCGDVGVVVRTHTMSVFVL